MRRGSLAFGEGFVNGWWSCDQLDVLFTRLLRSEESMEVLQGFQLSSRLQSWLITIGERLVNWQSPIRALQVGRRHYDIDPRVYAAMLDSRKIYSCGYWENARSLEEAQEQKLRMICDKLELKKGERLLDIGCGWGGLAAYAAQNYGVDVVGITISSQQASYAKEKTKGLPVKILLTDYRSDLVRKEKLFDKIVSVGMLEHVGRRNDRKYFSIAANSLREEGLMLVQTIGSRKTTYQVDPWIDTYIFPNGRLPSAKQLCAGFEENFKLEDWHSFGRDYDKTLMAWWQNFDQAWAKLREDMAPSFYRLWSYYLLSSAGLFRSGQGQLWQIVLSKPSRKQMYRSIR
jgi:cyclopropane-fatty-acyl-phospholipid synthase